MKRWKENWDCISPIFKFSMSVRKVIYTTNTIESLTMGTPFFLQHLMSLRGEVLAEPKSL